MPEYVHDAIELSQVLIIPIFGFVLHMVARIDNVRLEVEKLRAEMYRNIHHGYNGNVRKP